VRVTACWADHFGRRRRPSSSSLSQTTPTMPAIIATVGTRRCGSRPSPSSRRGRTRWTSRLSIAQQAGSRPPGVCPTVSVRRSRRDPFSPLWVVLVAAKDEPCPAKRYSPPGQPLSVHASRSLAAVLDYPGPLPQVDGRLGPALAGGLVGRRANLKSWTTSRLPRLLFGRVSVGVGHLANWFVRRPLITLGMRLVLLRGVGRTPNIGGVLP
jgi:hypothetical protein